LSKGKQSSAYTKALKSVDKARKLAFLYIVFLLA